MVAEVHPVRHAEPLIIVRRTVSRSLAQARSEERLFRHLREPVQGPHLAPLGKVLNAHLPALEEYHSVYTVLPGPGRRVRFLA